MLSREEADQILAGYDRELESLSIEELELTAAESEQLQDYYDIAGQMPATLGDRYILKKVALADKRKLENTHRTVIEVDEKEVVPNNPQINDLTTREHQLSANSVDARYVVVPSIMNLLRGFIPVRYREIVDAETVTDYRLDVSDAYNSGDGWKILWWKFYYTWQTFRVLISTLRSPHRKAPSTKQD